MKGVVLGLLISWGAWAAPPSVRITAEVVAVSSQGQALDPPSLRVMRDEFQKNPLTRAYTSFRRLSQVELKLVQGQSEHVPLADGRSAVVRLDQMKENTALVSVDVPKLVNTTLTLGRKGAIYQHVGRHNGGVLFLSLSAKGH